MAFVFVPNADGSFDEGMRQTNPDTGVEYIFTDNAWRPLGPKIEDQFDELDQRYLPLSGGTLTDVLYFDRGTEGVNMLIYPNANDTSSSIYALNSGAIRFRTSRTESLVTGTNTHIVIGRTDTLEPQTNIYHLAYPQENNWAANKAYVDEQVGNIQLDGDYLPLTGGTLTGDLDIENKHLYVSRGDDINFIIEPSGFCRTKDLFRADRNESGPCFQGRLNGETNFEVRSEGTVNCGGDITLRDQKRIKVRGTGNTDVGYFMATSDNQCQLGAYSGKLLNIKNLNAPSAATDAASKIYVDTAIAPFVTQEDIDNSIDNETIHLPLSGGSLSGAVLADYSVGQNSNEKILTTKKYVDDTVRNSSTAPSNFRPPGLLFNYESGSGSVSSGKFKWYTDGGRKLKISATSLDLPWGTNSPIGDISFSESHLFHIYATTTTNGVTAWKVKTTGSFNRMDWHTNDILLYVPYSLMNGDFSTTAAYYITVAGLF